MLHWGYNACHGLKITARCQIERYVNKLLNFSVAKKPTKQKTFLFLFRTCLAWAALTELYTSQTSYKGYLKPILTVHELASSWCCFKHCTSHFDLWFRFLCTHIYIYIKHLLNMILKHKNLMYKIPTFL